MLSQTITRSKCWALLFIKGLGYKQIGPLNFWYVINDDVVEVMFSWILKKYIKANRFISFVSETDYVSSFPRYFI